MHGNSIKGIRFCLVYENEYKSRYVCDLSNMIIKEYQILFNNYYSHDD